jgi:hypothetical protein
MKTEPKFNILQNVIGIGGESFIVLNRKWKPEGKYLFAHWQYYINQWGGRWVHEDTLKAAELVQTEAQP